MAMAHHPSRTAETVTSTTTLPTIPFGPHRLSRLICGANPFNAGSHLSWFVNREMASFYTPEQVLKTLRRCQEVGINCWQSSPGSNWELYRRFIKEGGRMHYLSLGHEDPAPLPAMAAGGCIGIAYHGEVTDQLFKSGQIEQARDYLRQVRDAGMQVGVSTHMPAVVEHIESAGWDVDFYMTCVYERHRTADELRDLLGHVPLPVGEVYLTEDPPRMYQAMQRTRKPCLAFKILAAGRLSERREFVEQAFRDAFRAIKPNDAVIVGIYDRYADQVADNAEMVRQYGATAARAGIPLP
jgi:hypothetical protein